MEEAFFKFVIRAMIFFFKIGIFNQMKASVSSSWQVLSFDKKCVSACFKWKSS